ncbi:MAG: GHKL domain-containing protein [Gammaproteobacteria bacterium]|nr:GHKL domain-containing protein [Gammaproteobacteria bacterium]
MRLWTNFSLRARLLLVSAIVLSFFFTVLAVAVSQTFDLYLQDNARERLKLQIFNLISVAEINPNAQLSLPVYLREQRFNQAHSGLYGIVLNDKGRVIWRSISAKSLPVKNLKIIPRGQWSYERLDSVSGESMILLKYGISWEASGARAKNHNYNIIVLERLRPLREEIQGYRLSIFFILILLLSVLLILEAFILRWGLNPLRKLTKDLRKLESGGANQLEGDYPKELNPLVGNLNLLLANEREQRQRYRNTMADLAHSLKTPLAVLKGLENDPLKKSNVDICGSINEQVERMDNIVQHQLQRAVLGSQTLQTNWIKLAPYVQSTLQALEKIYGEKRIQVNQHVSDDLSYCGDENDLMDILGNLLDNAFKQCQQQVDFTAWEKSNKQTRFLILQVEDDGPGVPEQSRTEILKRGVRLDSRAAGHGVGLATVMTIIEGYRGRLEIDDSYLGGALFRVILPLK